MQVPMHRIARNAHIFLPEIHICILQIVGNMNDYTQIAGIPVIAGKLASLHIWAGDWMCVHFTLHLSGQNH